MSDQSNSTPESSTDAELKSLYMRAWRRGAMAKSENSSEDWSEQEILDGFKVWRDRCVAEAVETAKLEGAIEQLQKSKRYYGPPMYGGIDNRINRLKRKLAALSPITGEGEK